jgi:hypothetical protein
MTSPEAAAEHLKVIRSLMERANTYRAISAPGAFVGGLLALATAATLARINADLNPGNGGNVFTLAWLIALAVSGLTNALLLARHAASRGEPFFSPGMRLALRSLTPPLFVGGLLGITQAVLHNQPDQCAITWILCYGLALLATANFAPLSIRYLGMAFVGSGTLLLLLWHLGACPPDIPDTTLGAIFMALTFGILHLVYALSVGLKKHAHDEAG